MYIPPIDEILNQVNQGVLGRELCPQPHFWHWPVLQPDKLPEKFHEQYETFGEIRW